ncbi:O-antigen ligase family protein [Microbacterium sp. zg-YB36]|uniref:O-antigen ligase family protein n=1 Tax=Microbacterium sp. zg-YB36 TaxID=2969407 RepID=UPI00214ABDDE|nr:O-antigen ligase family protein [Microbacterium sp. zg-YB36]MDL5352591.1 O-antigen ligase family protein [Microbacterium sp. zg-YB36]
MTAPHEARDRGFTAILSSAAMASAFTYAALGAVFAGFAIERLTSRTTYVTVVLGLCVVGAAMLTARRREISALRLVPSTLVVFLLWLLVSVTWSQDATATLAGWAGMVGLAFLAVVIGHVRDTLQTARALGDVMRVLLTVSLAVEVLSGILLDMPLRFLGVQGNIALLGPIQGIFGTRNALGFIAVLALITFLIEYRTMSVRPGVSLYSAVLAGTLAALSDSPTVLVLAVAVAAATAALALVRRTSPVRRRTLQWILGGGLVLGIGIAYTARHTIIGWIGAARDFSTRADLWAQIVVFVRARPIQGWGWSGSWSEEFPFGTLNYILRETHRSALNAYFDVLLQVGWVGLILFAIFVGLAFVRSWLVASERRSIVYAWTPLILVALLVDSVFESFTLAGYGWLMLVLCALRAGQSRSWRERIDEATQGTDLPPVGDLPWGSDRRPG